MPHTYRCPMRWADMDLLGHVNNVTYLDYVTEARVAAFAGHPLGRAPVVRHQVAFVMPLVFRREPVLVDTWVTGEVDGRVSVAHEVYDAPSGPEKARRVYLRVATLLDHRPTDEERALTDSMRGPVPTWREVPDQARPPGDDYVLVPRRSDLDERGHAREGVLLEYVQEARIHYMMNLHSHQEPWSAVVVAQTDIDYRAPVVHRQEPYLVNSWVAHVGSRSFSIRAEVRDGGRTLALCSAVMVAYDLESQSSTQIPREQRARLQRELHIGA